MPKSGNFSARLPKFDDGTLQTFLCVAQLRSFSATAEALNKTTSTVSYRIKLLEDTLNVPLFVRTTRYVQLTAAGEVLFERVKQIFDSLEFLPEEIKQVSDGVEPKFTIIINNLLYQTQAAVTLLEHLMEKFPYTVFHMHHAVYMGVWDEMLYGGGHFALGAPGFHTINNDFSTKPLGTLNWAFVVAPDHPLAKLPGPLSDTELRPFTAINVQDTAQHLAKRTAWRLTGQREFLVPDVQTKLACHLRGLGVGFLPRAMVHSLLKQKQLVECSVQIGRTPSPLSLAWRNHNAGRITAYLHELCDQRHELLWPFLSPLDPSQK